MRTLRRILARIPRQDSTQTWRPITYVPFDIDPPAPFDPYDRY